MWDQAAGLLSGGEGARGQAGELGEKSENHKRYVSGPGWEGAFGNAAWRKAGFPVSEGIDRSVGGMYHGHVKKTGMRGKGLQERFCSTW